MCYKVNAVAYCVNLLQVGAKKFYNISHKLPYVFRCYKWGQSSKLLYQINLTRVIVCQPLLNSEISVLGVLALQIRGLYNLFSLSVNSKLFSFWNALLTLLTAL
jgi:hypothetical protein